MNINEAVNFAPPDWLDWGLDAIADYRNVKRLPVFCFELLLTELGQNAGMLWVETAKVAHRVLKKLIDREYVLRSKELDHVKETLVVPPSHGSDSPTCMICGACAPWSWVKCHSDEDSASGDRDVKVVCTSLSLVTPAYIGESDVDSN